MKDNKTTHFGFKKVSVKEKASKVADVFHSVAGKYDLMNDLMSVGVHRLWKRYAISLSGVRAGQSVLDVAGGTGDISFKFINRAKGLAKATVFDMTESMLYEGQKRSEAANLAKKLEWVCGDAMSLPFKNNMFDVYTISFGIRNVTEIRKAIAEAYRVLKIGGRITVLEFGQMPDELLQKIYNKYSFKVIPELGRLIAGDRESYQYLVESIRRFPKQDDFAELLRLEGFENVKYRNMSFGIAAIHSGWKV